MTKALRIFILLAAVFMLIFALSACEFPPDLFGNKLSKQTDIEQPNVEISTVEPSSAPDVQSAADNEQVESGTNTANPSTEQKVPDEPYIVDGKPYFSKFTVMDNIGEDGKPNPVVAVKALMPKGYAFGDVYIYRGEVVNEDNLIAIQTAQEDVDAVPSGLEQGDGSRWWDFTGTVYWFDNQDNVPNDDDIVTIVVTGFKDGDGESPMSNTITGKWAEFKRVL